MCDGVTLFVVNSRQLVIARGRDHRSVVLIISLCLSDCAEVMLVGSPFAMDGHDERFPDLFGSSSIDERRTDVYFLVW